MLKIYKLFIFPLLLVSVLSCWNQQEHDITKPIVPHYILNGTAVDYDTRENLANLVIKLSATKMLYDVEFEAQFDTTDSSGNFSFDPVYPGYYNWSVQKDGCWLAEQKLQMQHRDSSAVIPVPQLYYAQEFDHPPSSHPALAINGTKAWFNVYSMTPFFKKTQMFKTYMLINREWFEESYYSSTLYKKNVTSMAFGPEALYVCVAPDTLYIINKLDGQLTGKYQLSKNITAVTFNPPQNCIYTCSKNNIYRHESSKPTNIIQTWNYENSTLAAIAYYKGIFTYDNKAYLFRQYDPDMAVKTTYVLINSLTKRQMLEIYDMNFDGYGQLWISFM